MPQPAKTRGVKQMRAEPSLNPSFESRILKKVYALLIFLMGLTGFAQMPIFKRYYIADIPGLGWLADFYLTHTLHYIGAVFLLGLFAYYATLYLMRGRRICRLTAAAYVRIAILLCLVSTGIIRVLKNLPDVTFSPRFTQFVDLAHLGFMIIFMIAALLFFIFKKVWTLKRRYTGNL